jgi:hypothetical protein
VLPAVVAATEALAAEAPLLWDEAPGNPSYRFEIMATIIPQS